MYPRCLFSPFCPSGSPFKLHPAGHRRSLVYSRASLDGVLLFRLRQNAFRLSFSLHFSASSLVLRAEKRRAFSIQSPEHQRLAVYERREHEYR